MLKCPHFHQRILQNLQLQFRNYLASQIYIYNKTTDKTNEPYLDDICAKVPGQNNFNIYNVKGTAEDIFSDICMKMYDKIRKI